MATQNHRGFGQLAVGCARDGRPRDPAAVVRQNMIERTRAASARAATSIKRTVRTARLELAKKPPRQLDRDGFDRPDSG
jgi:hypothetical protein